MRATIAVFVSLLALLVALAWVYRDELIPGEVPAPASAGLPLLPTDTAPAAPAAGEPDATQATRTQPQTLPPAPGATAVVAPVTTEAIARAEPTPAAAVPAAAEPAVTAGLPGPGATIGAAEPAETGPSVESPEPSAHDEQVEQVEQEAEAFVSTLIEPDPVPVDVSDIDRFVPADQVLSLLPPDTVERIAGQAELLADPSLAADTPITVVKEIEEVELIMPERLIALSAGDLQHKVNILQGNQVVQKTVQEALEMHAADAGKAIPIVKKVRYFQITTPGELSLDTTVQGEAIIGVIKKPYHLEAATVADLLRKEKILDPEAVFYVRTVLDTDTQGIWGIVQSGLIDNFARGMAIRRGEEINTYRVEIPRYADEVLANRSSSFLGRLIYHKTLKSYVYNFKRNKMGRNPDELVPGQEIVIIKFLPDELIGIYKHFVAQQS